MEQFNDAHEQKKAHHHRDTFNNTPFMQYEKLLNEIKSKVIKEDDKIEKLP